MRTILFLMRKEILQVFRDRIMPYQIFLAPFVLLLVLSNAMTFEVRDTALVLLDGDGSPASRALAQAFEAGGRFHVAVQTASDARAERALLDRSAGALLRIPEGFERDLRRGAAPAVQLVLNAEDGAAAGVVQSYAAAIVADFGRAWMQRVALRPPALAVRTRKLYNPTGRYRDFMAIGLLASLLTMIGVLLTAQNIAREKEVGTLEQLNATPITRVQFIAGKLLPFWIIGLAELSVGLVAIHWVFGVAFVGNPLVVYAGAALYLVAALGLGLLISTAAATQQQAMFLTFFTLVTLMFLGGIFTPVQSMPPWAQALAEVNPIKHFVVVLRSVLLKGAGLADVAGELAAMALFAAAVLPIAVLRYRKTTA